MIMEWATISIGVCTLVVQTVAVIVGGIWALSKTEAAIRQQIYDHKLENEERVNNTSRQVGDTVAAIRQKIVEVDTSLTRKISEVELYVRDTFLQKESFRAVISEIMNDMKNLGDRIENRLLRMETKLDRAHDRNHSGE
jgi:hypothetical protein